MNLLAIIIILLATAENMAPLIIGWLRTPPNAIFLGTVHHPADYFYYLSQFAQGADRWITTMDLYTSEPIGSSFIGWFNVLLGRLWGTVGIPPLFAYHLSVLLFTIILFVSCYQLARVILSSRHSATIALYLFTIFHAFRILWDGKPSYGDYWNNFAVPRVRFGAVPHQLFTNVAAIVLIYVLIGWIQHKRPSWKMLFVLGISSVVLASMQPILWIVLCASTSLSFVLTYPLFHAKRIRGDAIHSLSSILFLLALGVPVLLYMNEIFQHLPFLQLKLWEAAQHNYFDIKGFILATGPIFLLSIVSIPVFLSTRSFARVLIFLYPLLSIGLFLSPISALLPISHVRFMSTITILCLSIIAAEGIMKYKKFAPLILIVLTIYLVPNHLLTIRLASNFETNNAYQYLSKSDYHLLQTAARLSTPNDTFLVLWPYNVVFPGLTGRRIYAGHPLLTIDAQRKEAEVFQFFSNELPQNEVTNLLTTNHITYVIAYSWTQLPNGLYDMIAKEGSIALYRVNQAYLKTYSK